MSKSLFLIPILVLVTACTLQYVTGNDNDVSEHREPKPTIQAELPLSGGS
jgi:hypothetical protein